MSIRWQCPFCHQIGEEYEELNPRSVACGGCSRELALTETLCEVCDAPNPWRLRDSLHLCCRKCGHSQMLHSHLRSA